jgi:(2Fe-2S) ferredoxin
VYPEGVWYTYVDQEDLEEIIQEHRDHTVASSSGCSSGLTPPGEDA